MFGFSVVNILREVYGCFFVFCFWDVRCMFVLIILSMCVL